MKTQFKNATAPFADLPDIAEVTELTRDEESCIKEIREVLHRHGKQKTFGLTRLHRHFDVQPDEVLIEECDVANRTLTIKPQRKDQVRADRVIETNWRLDTMEVIMGCSQYCTQSGSSHTTHHSSSGG